MKFQFIRQLNNVGYLTEESDSFSSLYLKVRERECRVLTDKQLAELPYASSDNENWREWVRRQKSTTRFIDYLNEKSSPLQILDLGCGNGWFTNILAQTKPEANVIGIDINPGELEQAARVFNRENLQFIYANIFSLRQTSIKQFDLITINASIQYFDDIKQLKILLKSFLKPLGEIHIIDSPIYLKNDLDAAKQRTEDYYKDLGFHEMARYYFHHCFEDLKEFKILYRPKKSIISKFMGFKDSPFPWLKFVNESRINPQ